MWTVAPSSGAEAARIVRPISATTVAKLWRTLVVRDVAEIAVIR
ncbi:hypothetical protein ACIRRH_34930 [Kitasatospora sp. NPDC101235]